MPISALRTRAVFRLRDHWYMLVSKTHERDDTHIAFGLESGSLVYVEPSEQVTPAQNARVVINDNEQQD